MAVDPVLVFDTPCYARTLCHIGAPHPAPQLGATLLQRPIAGQALADVVGPWPYASAPSTNGLQHGLDALAREGFVSLTMFIRPGAAPPAYGARVTVAPLKNHFIHDPERPAPALGAKTRRNLAIAARHWSVGPLPPARLAGVGAALHRLLAARRDLGSFASVADAHFDALAGLDGIEAMAACDGEGPGAVLIAARSRGQTHLLHLLTSPRAIPSCGAHLLMHTALQHWSRDGCVYMGGAPDGPAGAGIARFKARWANRLAPAHLLKAVLRPDTYRALARGRAPGGYFPAYRARHA